MNTNKFVSSRAALLGRIKDGDAAAMAELAVEVRDAWRAHRAADRSDTAPPDRTALPDRATCRQMIYHLLRVLALTGQPVPPAVVEAAGAVLDLDHQPRAMRQVVEWTARSRAREWLAAHPGVRSARTAEAALAAAGIELGKSVVAKVLKELSD